MFDRYIPQDGWQRVDSQAAGADFGGMSSGLIDNLLGFLNLGKSRRQESRHPFQGVPFLEQLDTGDILLLLVLYYLYQESGDEEWLIILALLVFL